MKTPHLAPAVLASIAAAGLVLSPVAASAQDDPTEKEEALTQDESGDADEGASSEDEDSSDDAGDTDAPADDGSDGSGEGDDADADAPEADPDEPGNGDEEAEPETDEGDNPSGDEGDDADEEDGSENSDDEDSEEAEPAPDFSGDTEVSFDSVVSVDGANVSGAEFTFTGIAAESAGSVTVTVSGGEEGEQPADVSTTNDDDGTVSGTARYVIDAEESEDLAAYAGTRTATLEVDEQVVGEFTFEILAPSEDDDEETDEDQDEDDQDGENQDGEAGEPALTVQDSIAVTDIAFPTGDRPEDGGLPIAASGLEPGESYAFNVVPPEGLEDVAHTINVTASEEGAAAGLYYIAYSGELDLDILAGDYSIELLSGDEVLEIAGFTVLPLGEDGDDEDEDDSSDEDETDDPQGGEDDSDQEESYSAEISISPSSISARNFTNENKGVQVTASNCAPGEDVYLDVHWPGSDDVAYSSVETADENGEAWFSFYGTGNDLSAYVGTWKAAVSCSDTTATGTFEVTGGSGHGGEDGSELPRTGSDSSALALGAASLLMIGGATVMLTTRRKQKGAE